MFRGVGRSQRRPLRVGAGLTMVACGLLGVVLSPVVGLVVASLGLLAAGSVLADPNAGVYVVRGGRFVERTTPVQTGRVVIDGKVGGPQNLYVGGSLVWWCHPKGMHSDGVAVADVTWLAETLAEELGQPLKDRRDGAMLRRWESDHGYRLHLQLQEEFRRCQAAHRELYDLAPVEPLGTTTLSSATYRVGGAALELTAADVQQTALASIDELVLLVKPSGARLVARCGTRQVQLLEATRHPDDVAHLLFVTLRVQEAIYRVVDRGSREDVPSSMGRLRGQGES